MTAMSENTNTPPVDAAAPSAAAPVAESSASQLAALEIQLAAQFCAVTAIADTYCRTLLEYFATLSPVAEWRFYEDLPKKARAARDHIQDAATALIECRELRGNIQGQFDDLVNRAAANLVAKQQAASAKG